MSAAHVTMFTRPVPSVSSRGQVVYSCSGELITFVGPLSGRQVRTSLQSTVYALQRFQGRRSPRILGPRCIAEVGHVRQATKCPSALQQNLDIRRYQEQSRLKI